MRFCDLSFVLMRCSSNLWKFAEYLKGLDNGDDTSEILSICKHIDSFNGVFDSMTLGDLEKILRRSYYLLEDFIDLTIDDAADGELGELDFLVRVLNGFVFRPARF